MKTGAQTFKRIWLARPHSDTADCRRRTAARRQRGTSFLELLVAGFIIAIAAGWALAAWNISSRAPAQKRVTEMGAFVASQELERIKSERFMALTSGAQAPQYFDKFGTALGTSPGTTAAYRADATITAVVNRDVVGNTEDLLEIQVVVMRPDGTGTPYETARTLLTFGGM